MAVKKNIFYNVLLSGLQLLFPMVTAPYVARVLGVGNIGLVDFVNSYVGYFVLFAVLGAGFYGVREIAKYKNDTEKTSLIFSGIFQVNMVATIIVTIAYCLSVFFVPFLHKNRYILIISGMALYLAPISIDWYFQGLENFKMITFRSLVIRCLTFAGMFVFVRQRNDVIPYILLSVFTTIATNIWNLIYACRHGLKIQWHNVNVKLHVKPMLIFFATNVSISIFTALDVLMLGFLSSYKQVGFFTAPQKILVVILSALGAINYALVPRISFNRQQNDKNSNALLLQKTFDLYVLLLFPSAIGLCLIASHFVPLFFGSEFIGCITPMRILSFKILFSLINGFFAFNIMMIMGYERKFLMIVVATGIFSFVLNWILIPRFGAVGAATTALVAESIELPLILFFVYKMLKMGVSWKMAFNSILYTIPFFLIYILFDKIITNNILFLVIFIGCCALLYMLLLLLTRNYLVIQAIDLIRAKITKQK